MKAWAQRPLIYEINTWVWLGELAQKYRRPVDLSSVPTAEWEQIACAGFDAVWLMGVWERSPAGIAIANRNATLVDEFRRVLDDFTPADNVGSPYCVRRYVVAAALGGAAGLASARRVLRERGVRLILDFVPNHVAPDHPWVVDHPDYFIAGDADDARREQGAFIELAGKVLACGRDPYFPAWPDVVQVNALDRGLRLAACATVTEIAAQCDGVRCDMAMLMLNAIFVRTWGARAGALADDDYWTTLIPVVKKRYPDFRFIAEAYWGLEWELQQQGFDFCYDKTLYDRLAHGAADEVRQHLQADAAYQRKMLRFIENHDEPRAAATFGGPQQQRAAALAALTLGGARLVHEGQCAGRQVRLPIFLGRRPAEAVDDELAAFYGQLLAALKHDALRHGNWQLCACSGWADNPSCRDILAWSWSLDDERYLVLINYGRQPAQARVHLPWTDLAGRPWRLDDLLAAKPYERDGSELAEAGLYVDLAAWNYHFFALHAR